MKHVFSVLSVAAVILLTVFATTTGCKKGDTGPKGDTGVANAVYSPWQNVTYQMQVQSGDTTYAAVMNTPKLTQDVLDKGSMHVYFNFGSAAQPDVVSLPYFDLGLIINTSFDLGHIYLVCNANASSTTSGGAPIRQYRYVFISGSVPARQNVDWKNYAAVKEMYGIKD